MLKIKEYNRVIDAEGTQSSVLWLSELVVSVPILLRVFFVFGNFI